MFWFALAVFAPSAPMFGISFLAFLLTNNKQDRFKRAGKHVAALDIEDDVYNAFKVMLIFFVLTVLSLILLLTNEPVLPSL